MYELNTLERIGEGRLSTVYRLDGGRMLKVFKYPNVAEYEFRQTSAVYSAGVSRQRPHGMTCVDGKDAIVYDFLEGELLMSAVDKDKSRTFQFLHMMADCHARIMLGVCSDLPSCKDGLKHAISHAPHLNDLQRARLLDGLSGMPGGDNVLHGDLHPMNIIVNGSELSAIDWMTGSRGDPAADIARTWFILRHSAMRDDWNLLESLRRNMLHSILGSVYLNQVCGSSGVKKGAVMRWLPIIAAARLAEDRPAVENKTILRIVERYCTRN